MNSRTKRPYRGRTFQSSRRALLAGLVPALLGGCAGAGGYFDVRLFPFPCLPDEYYGPTFNQRLSRFEYMDLEEQREPELCWAAAIAAVLQYHGRDVDQMEIVESVRGATGGRGMTAATLREVIKGLSGPWTTWFINNGNSTALTQDLNSGNPVIIGTRTPDSDMGHIVVAYGVEYAHNYADGRTYIASVDIWDPWFDVGLDTIDGCDMEDRIRFALHSWGPR